MGWFTKKSKQWEVQVGWLSFLAILIPFVFPPFAMLYMGIRAKIKSLIYASVLWGGLYFIGYVGYMQFAVALNVQISIFCIVLSGALVVAIYMREFFRRVHLKTIINLQWNTVYDYFDFMRRKEISEVLSVGVFIDHLQKWKQQINNNEIRGCIVTMIELTKSISSNSKHQTELFIERHAYSVENILQQYYQIELSKLSNDVIHSAEYKLRMTIVAATKAFENEINTKDYYNHLAIEVDSEMYIQDLKNKRLL